MEHPEEWYQELSAKLGHKGWLTAREIREAEEAEAATSNEEDE